MLAALRRQRILDELQVNGSAPISRLAEQLGVSEMTIRRDLAGLESGALLERVHGGAVLAQRGVEEPGFDKKVLCQQPEKDAIASAAAAMVKPGSAIGLSAGTTTYMLARKLAQVGGVTVLTISMKVWNELERDGDGRSHVILTGGDFRTPSDALVGPTADATIRSMYVDVLSSACTAWTPSPASQLRTSPRPKPTGPSSDMRAGSSFSPITPNGAPSGCTSSARCRPPVPSSPTRTSPPRPPAPRQPGR